jgi:hypothetical protein
MAVKHTFKTLQRRGTGKDAWIDEKIVTRSLVRSTAIKFHCMECSGGVRADVRDCNIPVCALYPFRPYQKKEEK